MSLVDHAKKEFAAVGWINKDTGEFEDEMQKSICQNVLELLEVFSKQGHSGTTAPYLISLFTKLASYEVLGPLTGDDSEWNEVSDGVFQNNRCSHVFKQADRFSGQPYDLNGRVFYTIEKDKNGEEFKNYYTNGDSFTVITFPYVPTTEYIEEPKDKSEIISEEV